MLAIEIDGESHHRSEVQKNDLKRQKQLERLGVRFLRFEDINIKNKLDDVLRAIQYWIEEHQDNLVGRGPTPDPSQEGTTK